MGTPVQNFDSTFDFTSLIAEFTTAKNTHQALSDTTNTLITNTASTYSAYSFSANLNTSSTQEKTFYDTKVTQYNTYLTNITNITSLGSGDKEKLYNLYNKSHLKPTGGISDVVNKELYLRILITGYSSILTNADVTTFLADNTLTVDQQTEVSQYILGSYPSAY